MVPARPTSVPARDGDRSGCADGDGDGLDQRPASQRQVRREGRAADRFVVGIELRPEAEELLGMGWGRGGARLVGLLGRYDAPPVARWSLNDLPGEVT